jgi:SAM-dependent methyltransferase
MEAAGGELRLACAPAPCDLCGEARARPIAADRIRGVDGTLTLARCEGCGLVRVEPMPLPESVRAYYAERSLERHDRALANVPGEEERLAERRVRYLVRHVPRGRLFDAGFGTGDFLLRAAACGYEVAGCDMSRPNVERLRARLPSGAFSLGSIEEQVGGGFDAVTFFHVLEHCRSPRAALDAAARLLRLGGTLVVEVPSVLRPRFRLRRRMLQNQLHLYHFSRATLGRLAEAAGFRPLAWSFHDHRAYAPAAPRNLYHLLRTGAENALLRLGLELGKNLRLRATLQAPPAKPT